MKKNLLTMSLLSTSLMVSAAMAADDDNGDDWKFRLGAATIYAPAFSGSEDYQMMAVPDVEVKYRDSFFASLKDGVGYNVINSNGLRMGPLVKYQGERKEDGENPLRISGDKTNALRGLGDVDGTVEVGGFLEYTYDPVTFKIEARQGVNGHEGFVGDASLTYNGEAYGVHYGIGPHARFANTDYNQTYYGINAVQSANSGLAQYDAGDGLVAYGVGAYASKPLTQSVSLSMFGRHDRLGDSAADSPLIQQRGSENQFVGGVGLSYRFGL